MTNMRNVMMPKTGDMTEEMFSILEEVDKAFSQSLAGVHFKRRLACAKKTGEQAGRAGRAGDSSGVRYGDVQQLGTPPRSTV